MGQEVIQAEAIVEESGAPVQLGSAFEWLATAEAQVDKALADGIYAKPNIQSADDYRLAKEHRRQIRALLKDIDDKKKSYTSEIKRVVQDFERRTKDVAIPLTTLEAEYKESIYEWDDMLTQQKLERLESYFFELVPALSGMVSFSIVKARFDSKSEWSKKSYSEVKAQEDLDRAAKAIENEYQAIDAMNLSDEERQELQSDYIEHLDLNTALTKHRERVERKKRLAAIEAERQTAERARAEAVKRAEAETPIVPLEPTEPVVTQPQVPVAPQESMHPVQTIPQAEPLSNLQIHINSGALDDWMLVIGQLMAIDAPISIDTSLNKEQQDILIRTLKTNNITGKIKRY